MINTVPKEKRNIYIQRQSTVMSEKSYLGEIPRENTVVVFRHSDFNVGHVAPSKYEKHRPLQRRRHNSNFLHFLAPKGYRQQVLRGQLQSGPVSLLRLPWVCECNTVEAGSVPLLIHHLADRSHSHNNATAFFSPNIQIYLLGSYLSAHDFEKLPAASLEATFTVKSDAWVGF